MTQLYHTKNIYSNSLLIKVIHTSGGATREAITKQQIEHYAMAVARWIQCEEAISKYGFLAKKPTGTVISSPYVTMAKEYMKLANTAWYSIYQVV